MLQNKKVGQNNLTFYVIETALCIHIIFFIYFDKFGH